MASYEQTWDSLESHSIPKWFRDEPFGVYFHWGPYSVPAYGTEWYPHYMYKPGTDIHDHHVEMYGDPATFGYHDFIPSFTANEFDAEEWIDVCVDAGASYVGITAIHHDGFAMWDSDITEWNAANMGPERDIVGELAAAARARGLKFLTTFHHAMTWWYYPRRDAFHTTDPEFAELYGQPHAPKERPPESYFERWRDMTMEVIDAYRPDLIWFDAGWGFDAFIEHDSYRREVVAYYYNQEEEWGKTVDVCHKEELPPGVGIVDHERARREEISQIPWLTDTSIDRASWSHVEDSSYKPVETMLEGFVDRLSKNGNTLMNVGPKADGSLPTPAVEGLRALGEWLDSNRDAIVGSRPGWAFGEGPTEVTSSEFEEASNVEFTDEDVRFLRNGGATFVLLMDWPVDGVLELETSLSRLLSTWTHRQPPIADIEVVGAPSVDVTWDCARNEDAEWSPVEHDDDRVEYLRVELPTDPPTSLEHVYALRIRQVN